MNPPLWQPNAETINRANLRAFMRWLGDRDPRLRFEDYPALWRWSVRDIAAFWGAMWAYFDVQADSPYTCVLASCAMPGARWFPGARLNYAAHVFRHAADDQPALIFRTETGSAGDALRTETWSWRDLRRAVGALAAFLRAQGVQPGDRVVGLLPNMPQAVVALLASASIGAVWSSCSPDLGAGAVLDRFRQIAPSVLIAADGYTYNHQPYDRRDVVRDLVRALPTLRQVVRVPYLDPDASPFNAGVAETTWREAIADDAPLQFTAVPFDHPLWVLYSSGTTGLPKPIVHSQGGILLEHLKALAFHIDLHREDRFFWFTTTGWMMWNFLVSGLLFGSTVLLYDGSPARDDLRTLWQFAEDTGMTIFGTSAAYLTACMKADLCPGESHNLRALRSIGSTGSPLSPEGFDWVYARVKPDVWLAPMSGGTDVCTAFVGGCPLLPVRRGEMQCRYLGADVQAFDDAGTSVVDQVGELVITQPMPSMPVYFWNDPDMRRYRASYFEMYPGVWRHGDWVRITPEGGVIIYGRSDATLNRHGVRIGTSEIYSVAEALPEVLDALVVDLEVLGGASTMLLFVALREGCALDQALVSRIRRAIRDSLSPRHVPDKIVQVPEVPRTLNGKKMEVPIKRLLLGTPLEQVVNRDAVANPSALDFFVQFAKQHQ